MPRSSWLFGPALSLFLIPFAAMAQTPPDCAKPSSRAERTICASADLKVAAEDMATLLRDTLGNSADDRDAIERAQKAFLTERDGTCADKSTIPACRALYEKRAADLAAQNSAAQKKLAAVVAGIPKDAKAAAAALQRYSGAPAKAWLVYLYQCGAVAAPDKDATVRRLVDEILNQGLPKDPYLLEEMANLGDVQGAPLSTSLLFLRHVLSTTEMDAPCFLFTKHGQPAFEAFGAFWGNARDETPGLCNPPSSLFDLPEWQAVSTHMDPAIEPALVERGSIRHGYERQFEVDDLQASLVPSTLLEAPMSAEAKKMAEQRGRAVAAFRSGSDLDVWPEKEYRAAVHTLPAAITATSKLYREKFKLNPQTADQAARAAADRFIAGRLGLIMPDD